MIFLDHFCDFLDLDSVLIVRYFLCVISDYCGIDVCSGVIVDRLSVVRVCGNMCERR